MCNFDPHREESLVLCVGVERVGVVEHIKLNSEISPCVNFGTHSFGLKPSSEKRNYY